MTCWPKRKTERFPLYRVQLGGRGHWLHTAEDLDQFRTAEQTRLGRDLVVAEGEPAAAATGAIDGEAATFAVQELHEVRSLNRSLVKLRELGLRGTDLVPLPRIAGREPAVRYQLEHGDRQEPLSQLRDLPTKVRQLGEPRHDGDPV